jgi:hypothetical protein
MAKNLENTKSGLETCRENDRKSEDYYISSLHSSKCIHHAKAQKHRKK